MDSVKEYLATPYGIMLNAPSYTVPDDDIGFITRVYPGVKENGAIFSHPNPWAWAAECVLGRGNRAMEYYNSLCPYNQNDMIEIREAEPYLIASLSWEKTILLRKSETSVYDRKWRMVIFLSDKIYAWNQT